MLSLCHTPLPCFLSFGTWSGCGHVGHSILHHNFLDATCKVKTGQHVQEEEEPQPPTPQGAAVGGSSSSSRDSTPTTPARTPSRPPKGRARPAKAAAAERVEEHDEDSELEEIGTASQRGGAKPPAKRGKAGGVAGLRTLLEEEH